METGMKCIVRLLLVASIVTLMTLIILVYLETTTDGQISPSIQAVHMSGGGD